MRAKVALREAASRQAIGFDQTVRGGRCSISTAPNLKRRRYHGMPEVPLATCLSPPVRTVSVDAPTRSAESAIEKVLHATAGVASMKPLSPENAAGSADG